MKTDLRVFGIRHHGPGSTRRLESALRQWQPDYLLVEGPADAQAAVAALAHPDLRPPVALVLFDEKEVNRASFLPFASFSPEYRALRWAIEQEVPYELMDLPAKHYLAARPVRPADLFGTKPPAASAPRPRDPLAELADLAGYADTETWWDATFEREEENAENSTVFEALNEAVAELRRSVPESIDDDTKRREAYMRQCIRKAVKAGHERIAVVCGAWHGPALADWAAYKVATDRARLKGLPRTKVTAAWVPWSYPRLARESGYGAGVVSPAWYEMLYAHPAHAVDRWMTAAARLLREEGYDASPARAVDAVRLARTLAAMRGHRLPGREELREAAEVTLADGKIERLALIRERLTVGTAVGRVPDNVGTVPLLKDLREQLKSTRLSKYWETTGQQYLKANKARPRGGLDLRSEADITKSYLLHRLRLLNIDWGTPQEGNARDLGSFREVWLLEWQPELSLRLLELAGYGNTVADAAQRYVLKQAGEVEELPRLAALIAATLRAGLPRLTAPLVERLRTAGARSDDWPMLLKALPDLAATIAYGDVRRTDTTALVLLLEELLPRLRTGLPNTLHRIEDEAARDTAVDLLEAHRNLARLELPAMAENWLGTLVALAADNKVHPRLNGLANRLLFDQGELNVPAAEQRFHRALSPGNRPPDVAAWMAGFLHGSGLLLLHHNPLWRLVDGWVSGLVWEDFEEVLPLLRPTFSEFSGAERRQLFERVGRPQVPPGQADGVGEQIKTPPPQAEEVVPVEAGLLDELWEWI